MEDLPPTTSMSFGASSTTPKLEKPIGAPNKPKINSSLRNTASMPSKTGGVAKKKI